MSIPASQNEKFSTLPATPARPDTLLMVTIGSGGFLSAVLSELSPMESILLRFVPIWRDFRAASSAALAAAAAAAWLAFEEMLVLLEDWAAILCT